MARRHSALRLSIKGLIPSFCFLIYRFLFKPFLIAVSANKAQNCRFQPCCSEYAKEAFCEHTFFRAFFLVISRLLRCNPWTRTNVYFDFVPDKKGTI